LVPGNFLPNRKKKDVLLLLLRNHKLLMGLRDKFDVLMHGGVQQPPSHERKKNYELGEILGK
jgi:hypothetical protein